MSSIDFPGNYENYLRKGQEALVEHHLAEGLIQLEAAYQIEHDPIVNWMISSTAFELGEYSKSLSYIEELPKFYLEEESRAELYLQNLLMQKNFLNARKLIWEIQKQGKLKKEKVQSFTDLLEMQEAFYQHTQRSLIREIKKELEELPKLPKVYQLQAAQKFRELPQKDLLDTSKKILVNTQVSPLVRNFLFEELVKLGTKDIVSILAVDGYKHSLYPYEIGTSNDSTLKRTILEKLTDFLENQDPVLLANLQEEVKLEMALLYPLHQLYDKSDFWINSYLSEYLQKELSLDQKVESIRHKIKKELNGFYEG
ncbi:hypothetical protein JZO67_002834 [Enterococcus sp. 665A]|uniref:Hydrolase n=1 Tax=Candidatus Enterococcus ferrettii TaxID=2815324 RepID=A0ABV0EQH7_9ENTE